MDDQSEYEIDKILKQYFDFLIAEFGFVVTSKEFFPKNFGNLIIKLEKDGVRITISRDRNQVFIDFFTSGMGEKDKESILEETGISRNRYPTKSGLWTGYEIEKQSMDLKQHLKLMLDYIESKTLN